MWPGHFLRAQVLKHSPDGHKYQRVLLTASYFTAQKAIKIINFLTKLTNKPIETEGYYRGCIFFFISCSLAINLWTRSWWQNSFALNMNLVVLKKCSPRATSIPILDPYTVIPIHYYTYIVPIYSTPEPLEGSAEFTQSKLTPPVN